MGVADSALTLDAGTGVAHRLLSTAVALGLHVLLFGLLFALARGVWSALRPSSAGPGTGSGRRGLPAALAGTAFAAGAALAFLGAESRDAPREAGAPPNLIVVSIDTLRADHLGSYGYTRDTSPHLDALARQGSLFENAYSTSSWTLPAHATLLTGLDPFAHGVASDRDALAGPIETVAESLRAAGYRTEAWVGTDPFGFVGAAFGLSAGFDGYRHYPHPKRYRSSLIARAIDGEILRRFGRDVGNARAQVESILDWLEPEDGRPFFLFVHLYDVHSKTHALPYEAPEPFRDRFCPGEVDGFAGCRGELCASDRLRAMADGREPRLGPDETAVARCLYDGGIAFVDAELGRLLDALEASGLAERTAVFVTSDHGEAFFEHGRPLHVTLHEEITRIPLIARIPGGPAGQRLPQMVDLGDVAPTLLDLAGVPAHPAIQGVSLLPLLQGRGAPAIGQDNVAISVHRTLFRQGSTKYIEGGKRPARLYQLREDPGERDDRAARDPVNTSRMAAALERRRTSSEALHERLLAGEVTAPVNLDEQQQERLRALGYVTGDPGPSDSAESPPEPSPAPPGAPSILLITIDTLRADRLGVYGHRLDTSPNIDALAARGARFTNAMVQWPKTWPSLASFLTGTYPRSNGIGAAPRALPDSLLTLAELFQANGYDTAGVVSNFNAGRALRFDQGFAHFTESWVEKWREEAGSEAFVNEPGRVKEYTDARLVTRQALRWLWGRGDDDRPFFLWVHYMDPHGPYKAPREFDELFRGAYPSSEIPLPQLPPYQQQRRSGAVVTDLAFYQASYDREIRYLDTELARLLEGVRFTAPENTIVVFTSDHGESLGEHDYYLEHGLLSYQPTAAVPLLVVQPGVIEPGMVIDTPVGLIDVSSTLVELAGLPVPDSFEGTSLAARLRGESDAALPERVFMQSGIIANQPQLTVREGRWKLIEVRFPGERKLMTDSQYELYDLEADPGELENLADRHPERVERLSGLLHAWYAQRPRVADPGEALDVEELDEASRKMLEALGYLEP